MRRSAMMALAAGLLVGVGAGPAEGDKGQLLGIWKLASSEEDGRLVPRPTIDSNSHQMIFEKDGYTDVFKSRKGTAIFRGVYQVDPAKAPKEIDLATFDARKKVGPTFRAIYELKGDTLVICTRLDGKDRPARFHSAGSAICTFKRQRSYR